MKTEDIDRRIGMPDIDAEWERFEMEVMETGERPVLVPAHRHHLSRVAATILIILGVSVTAFASVYFIRVARPSHRATKVEVVPDSAAINALPMVADTTDVFMFDNVEVESVVRTLCDYYGLEPVFRNERSKKVRLYVTLEKNMTLDEMLAVLNTFKKVKLTVRDKKMIVE